MSSYFTSQPKKRPKNEAPKATAGHDHDHDHDHETGARIDLGRGLRALGEKLRAERRATILKAVGVGAGLAAVVGTVVAIARR